MGTSEDEVEYGRSSEAAAENKVWERELREAAYTEQADEWGEEQDAYHGTDATMGAGEMAMWNMLHPSVGGNLSYCEWGALHQAQYIRSPMQREVWLRVVAGCSRYTTVYAAKQGSYREFRSPHTEEQRASVLLCPCGVGVQDSLHVLRCQCSDVVVLRERVVAVTEECIGSWDGVPGVRSSEKASRKRSRARGTSTRRQVDAGRKSVLPTRGQHLQTETKEAWERATDERKILVSLGSNWANLPN